MYVCVLVTGTVSSCRIQLLFSVTACWDTLPKAFLVPQLVCLCVCECVNAHRCTPLVYVHFRCACVSMLQHMCIRSCVHRSTAGRGRATRSSAERDLQLKLGVRLRGEEEETWRGKRKRCEIKSSAYGCRKLSIGDVYAHENITKGLIWPVKVYEPSCESAAAGSCSDWLFLTFIIIQRDQTLLIIELFHSVPRTPVNILLPCCSRFTTFLPVFINKTIFFPAEDSVVWYPQHRWAEGLRLGHTECLVWFYTGSVSLKTQKGF